MASVSYKALLFTAVAACAHKQAVLLTETLLVMGTLLPGRTLLLSTNTLTIQVHYSNSSP
jgi:hypothetical protein